LSREKLGKETKMKTGNWDYVYLTRDSGTCWLELWNPNIGIVKYRGCVFFASARSLGKKGRIRYHNTVGLLSTCYCNNKNESEVQKQFGFLPPEGTAWLVNTTTLERKRIDKDMALIDPRTGKVVG